MKENKTTSGAIAECLEKALLRAETAEAEVNRLRNLLKSLPPSFGIRMSEIYGQTEAVGFVEDLAAEENAPAPEHHCGHRDP